MSEIFNDIQSKIKTAMFKNDNFTRDCLRMIVSDIKNQTVNANPQKDRLSLRTCVLTLTDDSFDRFMQDIAAVIDKYREAEENGKLRSVSFISAPIEEEGK